MIASAMLLEDNVTHVQQCITGIPQERAVLPVTVIPEVLRVVAVI